MNYLLEQLFIMVFKPFIPIVQKINPKLKNTLMTLCFMGIMFIFWIARVQGGFRYYKHYSLAGCIIMLMIAFLSLDQELKHQKIVFHVRYSFLLLSLIMIVSDRKIHKQFFGLGLLFFIVFPCVHFIWSNHSRRQVLWENFFRSIRGSFFIIVVFSFLFREKMDGMRYAGVFINPNMFGMLLAIIAVVYMIYFDRIVVKEQSIKKNLFLLLEVGVLFFLVLMTQARTTMLGIAVAFFVWFCVRYWDMRLQGKRKAFFQYVFAAVIAVIVCFPICNEALKRLPKAVNHPITYEKDRYYANVEDGILSPKVVLANESTTLDRFLTEFKGDSLDDISNGRIGIYKGYLKKINLVGHKKTSLYINGVKAAHAHNNIIQYGFSYGVFGMIAYAILTITTFIGAIFYFKENKEKEKTFALFPMLLVLCFSTMAMTEAIFLPFQCFPAFAFYFVIGEISVKKNV